MAFTNRDRLRRKMKAIPVEVKKAAREQLKKNAEELVETQKRFAAASFKDPTGKLQSGIKQQDVSDSTRISRKVSASAKDEKGRDYAAWVEFGTSKSEAAPYFWPAYRLARRKFKARMTRAAKKALQEAVK
jgi:HK97 gp10 family phage protein